MEDVQISYSRVVDVRLGGEVVDRVDLKFCDDEIHQISGQNISLKTHRVHTHTCKRIL